MLTKKLTISAILTAAILLIIVGHGGKAFSNNEMLQSYQPPTEVSLTMFRLTENGIPNGQSCGAATQYNWGCTAYCTDPSIPSCVHTNQYPYPFNSSYPTVQIDGISGTPNISPYSQYLRDIVPLEIGIKLGSQGYKPASAIEAQVIAARTYIYQRIQYASQYGTPNNSNQFQVFVPYYYDTLTVLQKIMVQIATSNRHYLSESGSTYPIEALFGADNSGSTSQGNRPYLKSVLDPISQQYGTTDGTALGGMSSKGASRWGFGHTSSKGPASSTDSNYPHDADGSGDFWSVKYDSAARILTHYYTGVHLRDNGTVIVTPNERWTPLNITWSNNCPSPINHGQSCTATVQVQNTGVSDWGCGSATYVLSYRWAKSGHADLAGNNQVLVCNLAPGNTATVNLTINDAPAWGSGAYLLKLDVARVQSGSKTWFSSGGWPSYDINICVDGSCKAFIPQAIK